MLAFLASLQRKIVSSDRPKRATKRAMAMAGLGLVLTAGAARAELVLRAIGDGAAANQAGFVEFLQQARLKSRTLDALIARIEQDRQAQVTLTLRRDACGFLDSATLAGGKGRLEVNLNNLERLTQHPGDNVPAWALSPVDELAFALQEALVMGLAQLPLDQGAPKEAGLAGLNRLREEEHNVAVLAALERSQFGEDAAGPRDCQAPSTYREIRFAGGRYQYLSFDRWGHLHSAYIDLTALAPKVQPEGGQARAKSQGHATSLNSGEASGSHAPAPPPRPKRAATPRALPDPESTKGMPMPLLLGATGGLARLTNKPRTGDTLRAVETMRTLDSVRTER